MKGSCFELFHLCKYNKYTLNINGPIIYLNKTLLISIYNVAKHVMNKPPTTILYTIYSIGKGRAMI